MVEKKISADELWRRERQECVRINEGVKVQYIKFPVPESGSESVTIVKLVQDYVKSFYVKYVDDTEGNRRKIIISNDDWENSNINNPIIAEWKRTGDANLKPNKKWVMNAVTGKVKKFRKKGDEKVYKKFVLDNVVKVLEVGPTIFNDISWYRDDDDTDDVDKILFKIIRTGSNRNNTRYKTKCSEKNVPELVEHTELYDLDEISKPTSYNKINEILGLSKDDGEYEGDDVDGVVDDDDFANNFIRTFKSDDSKNISEVVGNDNVDDDVSDDLADLEDID
jgi:hypothetical protein